MCLLFSLLNSDRFWDFINHSQVNAYKQENLKVMKKIDILNFITNFRKAPNDVKTRAQLLEHLGTSNEAAIDAMLLELQQAKVIKETQHSGERAYQVISR